MKGIILAGGSGTRLHPLTLSVSKQLMPIYDKPMIYYPLSVLMMAGIREILIITTTQDQAAFQNLLSAGEHLGIKIEYAVQPNPEGIAQAFIIGEEFIGDDSVGLVLGDNIFYGTGLDFILGQATAKKSGATVFGYYVKNPSEYGVVTFDKFGNAVRLEEKPKNPESNYAITGLYFYDNNVVKYAKQITPSARGELEITDLNKRYLEDGSLSVQIMGRGFAWLDTGTFDSLLSASNFMQIIEERQGLKVACLEEIAYRKKFISSDDLRNLAKFPNKNEYDRYLINLLENDLVSANNV
jgi:glucose-1-phosphate thymidylyltransferase